MNKGRVLQHIRLRNLTYHPNVGISPQRTRAAQPFHQRYFRTGGTTQYRTVRRRHATQHRPKITPQTSGNTQKGVRLTSQSPIHHPDRTLSSIQHQTRHSPSYVSHVLHQRHTFPPRPNTVSPPSHRRINTIATSIFSRSVIATQGDHRRPKRRPSSEITDSRQTNNNRQRRRKKPNLQNKKLIGRRSPMFTGIRQLTNRIAQQHFQRRSHQRRLTKHNTTALSLSPPHNQIIPIGNGRRRRHIISTPRTTRRTISVSQYISSPINNTN